MTTDIRWKQRFQNFQRAFTLLREILESTENLLSLEPIVKEGIVQRFEYTFELAWKTLKDKLIEDGLQLEKISPKYVFKFAYQHKYLDSIELWIEMTNDRNLMSHTYDFATFDMVIVKLKNDYFPLLDKLYSDLSLEFFS